MHGHAFEFTTGKCVHEASLTNTVSTDQTVLSAVGQTELSIFEQCSTTNDNIDIVQLKILCLGFLVSIMADLNRRESLFLFVDFILESLEELEFLLGSFFIFLGLLQLSFLVADFIVRVGCSSCASESIIVSVRSHIVFFDQLHLVQCNGSVEFLSDQTELIFDLDNFLFQEHL